MNKFRIVPFDEVYTERIRQTRKDDFGHEVTEQLATGYGPCRVTLKPFVPGRDLRLLFSHSPFEIDNAFNQPGPVFIHKEKAEPYKDIHRFPPEIKADKKHFPMTLIGYSEDQQMVLTKLVQDRDADELIIELFEKNPQAAYLHARNAEAGCFICRIERA